MDVPPAEGTWMHPRMTDLSRRDDELFREFIDRLDYVFRHGDIVEDGVAVGYFSHDRATKMDRCRAKGWTDAQKNTLTLELFEDIVLACAPHVLKIHIRGVRHDYWIYLPAASLEEAIQQMSVYDVMRS